MSDNNRPLLDSEKVKIESLSSYATKAELYVVSLTFSILALSIQFPVETADVFVSRLQVASWILMMISGAAGVKLLRNVSVEYNLILAKYKFKNKKMDEAFIKFKNEIFDEWVRDVSKQGQWLIPVQGYCLFAGLLFSVFARAVANPLIW